MPVGSQLWQQFVDEHQFTRCLDEDVGGGSDLSVPTKEVINDLLLST